MGCCNIPVANLRRSVYHRSWDITTLCMPQNAFKTVKHSPNAYLGLEMNVHNSHIVVFHLIFIFNCSPFGRSNLLKITLINLLN